MTAQSDYRYTISVSGETAFDVVSFTLEEGLSQPFYLSLSLACKAMDADFAQIIDQPATLTFYENEEPVRYVNGIVTSLEQKKSGFLQTFYDMVIEPALVRARLQSDCRIFQEQDTRQIVTTLLKKNDVENFEFKLLDEYWTRQYCVQYDETDFHFIHRLLAEDGTYYYFEHTQDSHTMHMVNDIRFADSTGEIEYNANPATGERPQACLTRFGYKERMQTTKRTQRDYTFLNPRYNLQHVHHARESTGESRQYENYGYPGRYKLDQQGQPFTRYRLEYERRETALANVEGDSMHLLTGTLVTLTGHAREDMNRDWLVISITHEAKQPGVLGEEAGGSGNQYHCTAQFIPSDKPWRPEPVMKPLVHGPQSGHVVGPAGEEIYCDEWGRVKIQFPWDREGQSNEFSSCWIRVSQAWAGAMFGNIAIPRIGHEVIVDFLEGDPDQPIVTGRTYHETTRPPYPLPENKTRMTIQSKTHKGDGFNELRFEDEMDQEEVFIHAQKDQNNVVRNNETTNIGNDRIENVGHDERINIGNDSYLAIAKNRIEKVDGKHDTTVISDLTQKVDGNRSMTIGGYYAAKSGSDFTFKADGEIVLDASKITLVSGSSAIVLTGGRVDIVPTLNVGSATPGAAAVPAIPAVLEAAAGNGSPFVSHCPFEDG